MPSTGLLSVRDLGKVKDFMKRSQVRISIAHAIGRNLHAKWLIGKQELVKKIAIRIG